MFCGQLQLEQSLLQAQQSHDKASKQAASAHAKELTTLRTSLEKELSQTQAGSEKEMAALATSLEKERRDAQERLALAARLRAEVRLLIGGSTFYL